MWVLAILQENVHPCTTVRFPHTQGFNNDKSPGCDGLTAEFYQTFFGVIGSDLVDVINYAFENERLTLIMRRGIIVLIWKGNEREY